MSFWIQQTVKCSIVLSLILLSMASAALRAETDAPPPAAVLYSNDFERLPLGPVDVGSSQPGPQGPNAQLGLVDNTYTGNRVEYRIVETDGFAGQALEIESDGYAQVILGPPVKVEAGQRYRFRGSAWSLGGKEFRVQVRHGPAPYKTHVAVQHKAFELWRRFDLTAASRNTDARGLVMLLVWGEGVFRLGDLVIEEYSGAIETAQPPVTGNMLQNSSFELGLDGWLRRRWAGGDAVVDDTAARSGHRSLRCDGDLIISAPYHPVTYGHPYTLSVWARAEGPGARIGLGLVGPDKAHGGRAIPDNGEWVRVELKHAFSTAEGVVREQPAATAQISPKVPAGTRLWIDDADLRAGDGGPYAPRAGLELAVTTDRPYNLLPAGESLQLQLSAVVSNAVDEAPPDTLRVDLVQAPLSGPPLKRWDSIVLRRETADPLRGLTRYAGSVTVPAMTTGYWRFATTTAGNPLLDGEALVSCVPPIPTNTPFCWQAGTHPTLGLPFHACGIRWARLHDCYRVTKWPEVEPRKGDWQWTYADRVIEQFQSGGYRILGLLDRFPDWRKKGGWYPDRDFTDWENYVRTVVDRYRGQVNAWEVLNEAVYRGKGPDGTPNPVWYVDMLKSAHRAAKHADPDAFIVGGGGAGMPSAGHAWWTQAIEAGLFEHCDAVSFHGYGHATLKSLQNPMSLKVFVDWLHERMDATIGRRLPIWDTEVGTDVGTGSRKFWWPTKSVYDAEEGTRQAVIAFLAEKSCGIEKTFFYAGFATSLYEPAPLRMFSNVNRQLTAAAVGVAVVVSLVEGLEPVAVPKAIERDGVCMLCYESADDTSTRRVLAVWAVDSEVTRVMLPVAEDAEITCLDLLGSPVDLQHDGEQVTVPVGRMPVYVVQKTGA